MRPLFNLTDVLPMTWPTFLHVKEMCPWADLDMYRLLGEHPSETDGVKY